MPTRWSDRTDMSIRMRVADHALFIPSELVAVLYTSNGRTRPTAGPAVITHGHYSWQLSFNYNFGNTFDGYYDIVTFGSFHSIGNLSFLMVLQGFRVLRRGIGM